MVTIYLRTVGHENNVLLSSARMHYCVMFLELPRTAFDFPLECIRPVSLADH